MANPKMPVDPSWPTWVKQIVRDWNAGRITAEKLREEGHGDWLSSTLNPRLVPGAITASLADQTPDQIGRLRTALTSPPTTAKAQVATAEKLTGVEQQAIRQGLDLKGTLEKAMLESGWSKQGVAVFLPQWEQTVAGGTPLPVVLQLLSTPPLQYRASAYATPQSRLPSPSNVAQAQEFYGFKSQFGATAGPPITPGTRGPPGAEIPIPGQVAQPTTGGLQTVPGGGQYEYNPTSGAIRYANGVIADPQSGNVYMPTDRAVPGNALWLRAVQQSWSQEKVQAWRTKLAQLGYIPHSQVKQQGFDAAFASALLDYEKTRYLNFGTPVSTGKQNAQNQITDLGKIRDTVRASVFSQFHALFGNDPSDPHVDRLTDYVISTANDLQRQKQLTAPAAEAEAMARIQNDPTSQYVVENQGENTSLHDALQQSVAAASSVMR